MSARSRYLATTLVVLAVGLGLGLSTDAQRDALRREPVNAVGERA